MREIVFDTETTGLDPYQGDRLVEIGCVELVNGFPTGQVFHAYLNPLVKWIWFGGLIVVLGTGLAMIPNRRAALVLRAAEQRSWGDRVAQSATGIGAVARRVDSHD